MNFSHVDPELTYKLVRSAMKKFTALIVELGVRENNEHVGSGLGGNNFQLLTLSHLNHHLKTGGFKITINDDIWWSANWLAHASMVEIRQALDAVFPSIKERHKYVSVLVRSMLKRPNDLRQTFLENKEHFPRLQSLLDNKAYYFDKNLSFLEQLVVASIMCQDLAMDLDKGDLSKVSSIGSTLSYFPPEIILLSVRMYINIERLVKHNLDEHPVFTHLLTRVNRSING